MTGRLGRSDHGRHLFGLRLCCRHCRQPVLSVTGTHHPRQPGQLAKGMRQVRGPWSQHDPTLRWVSGQQGGQQGAQGGRVRHLQGEAPLHGSQGRTGRAGPGPPSTGGAAAGAGGLQSPVRAGALPPAGAQLTSQPAGLRINPGGNVCLLLNIAGTSGRTSRGALRFPYKHPAPIRTACSVKPPPNHPSQP